MTLKKKSSTYRKGVEIFLKSVCLTKTENKRPMSKLHHVCNPRDVDLATLALLQVKNRDSKDLITLEPKPAKCSISGRKQPSQKKSI